MRTPDGPALGAFLRRLLHFDKAAAVRLTGPPGGGLLAVFGRPPFEVLAIRTIRVDGLPEAGVDATVSAGELLESLGEDGGFAIPSALSVAAAWAGMLPPRGGWTAVASPGVDELRRAVAGGVREFRQRVESLPEQRRTREELDATAARVWDAQVGGAVDGLPLRVAHAASGMGFLPAPAEHAGEGAAVLRNGPWWRLRTEYGEVAYRRPVGAGLGLTVG
ncbi:hypothetical protein BIV57_17005 [Mangrovactinospora gilvigrisea]|uniref:Uncharacterized protein n=1 Tax=Mangrovactinospora gilvigrisea TaxID=1428644 RepID=A0A1J7C9F5_9ACTN|nr:hypothetical protein [Mangrovactinospora gilvigrisea]OIV36274.1 hypothetical protein BIV57_17005 [Mangrovactinospora gilvigrisea]